MTSSDYNPPRAPWLSVIHRDEAILVLDKPSGLLTVPGKLDNLDDCLEKRARGFYRNAMIAHRLDRDTSGVIIMGMTRKAHADISQQFEQRSTRKTYLARVWGIVKEDSGRIDLPLSTDWERRPRQRVNFENGRAAQTDWEVLAREDRTTLMRLTPLTGRSHQLRVHMLELGHPIIGDVFYAFGEALAAADRLQLHACSLGITHPAEGKFITFRSPCPF